MVKNFMLFVSFMKLNIKLLSGICFLCVVFLMIINLFFVYIVVFILVFFLCFYKNSKIVIDNSIFIK